MNMMDWNLLPESDDEENCWVVLAENIRAKFPSLGEEECYAIAGNLRALNKYWDMQLAQ